MLMIELRASSRNRLFSQLEANGSERSDASSGDRGISWGPACTLALHSASSRIWIWASLS